MLCPPLALAVSVIGVVADDRKLLSIVTLLISGAFVLWFILSVVLLSLAR